MNMRQFTPVLILLGLAGAVAFAASSANYFLDPIVIDQGGDSAFSTFYTGRASIGGNVIGVANSPNYTCEADFGYTVMFDDGSPVPPPPFLVLPGPMNPAPTNEQNNAVGVTMLQVKLAAGANPVTVDSITFTASGSGNDSPAGSGGDIVQVHLFWDINGNGILDSGIDQALGSPQFFNGDNGTATFSAIGHAVPAATNHFWILVYDFGVLGAATKTFAAGVLSTSDVSGIDGSTGNPVGVSGPPFTGNFKTFNPGAGATGTLSVMPGFHNTPVSTCFPGDTKTVCQYQVAASSYEDISVQSLVLNAFGTGDEVADVVNVTLYEDVNSDGELDDGDVIMGGPTTYGMDDGQMSFAFNFIITAGTSQSWILVYEFTAPMTPEGLTFSVAIPDSSAITAQGQVSAQAVPPTLMPTSPLIGPEVRVIYPDPTEPVYFTGGCAAGPGPVDPMAGLGLLIVIVILGCARVALRFAWKS
jgi:hypothetical protein